MKFLFKFAEPDADWTKFMTSKLKDVFAQPILTSLTASVAHVTAKMVTDMIKVFKDVSGGVALTKSLLTQNVSVKETTTNKTVSVEPAQLLLSLTSQLKLVKATSFVVTTNSWSMETVNAELDSTELTVLALNVLPMPTLILSPKAADATKDMTWSMEFAQHVPPTNSSHSLPTDANVSSHTTGSTELAKPAKPDGNTMLMLNAATRRTHATLVKLRSMESVNACQDTEEIQMDSANLSFNAQPTVITIPELDAVLVAKDLFQDQANVFLKFHASKTVTPRTVFVSVMMDMFWLETWFNAEDVELTNFTTVKIACVMLDSPETQLDNVSEEISFPHVEPMKSMIVSSRFVCVNKTSTESTVNASSQSLVNLTHTGTVPDANATLDSLREMEPAFTLLIQSHNAHQTQSSTVSRAPVQLDTMKSQDSTAKDALMDKFGMEPNALGTLLAQVDTFGTINTEDVMLRPFNALKTLNGTELCACATMDSTWLVMSALAAHQTLLGTEETATHKFQSINAEATKS